ncbi:MAG: hypothetical protein QG597_2291 [Actinomycetota bacterium]|nr:hypothetical protein [Actinomycetota bacterium]
MAAERKNATAEADRETVDTGFLRPLAGHERSRMTALRAALGIVVTLLLAAVGSLVGAGAAQAAVGPDWTLRSPAAFPALRNWTSVAYGCPTPTTCTFVAVANDGTTDRVMTSPDGITWTTQYLYSLPYALSSVTYGNGLFVATAPDFGGILTSPDGVTWTVRARLISNWQSVTYGCPTPSTCTFVAVSNYGLYAKRVITSPDGITWTGQDAAVDNDWRSLTFGNGVFVAVGASGSGNRVMTSTDGIMWTSRTSAADSEWLSVTYGNSTFVAVSGGGGVMTSPDGITWATRTPAAYNSWRSVTYGNSMFVAVAASGSGDRVMTSPDGVTWTKRNTTGKDAAWQAVAFGNGVFVAVGGPGSLVGTNVMSSNPLFLTQSGNTMKIVPPSGGFAPIEYRIHYNTAARVASGAAWGQWGYQWPTTLSGGGTIDINLVTYWGAGSCTALGMPAANCPRPALIGTLDSGESMPFKVRVKSALGVWSETPVTTITRP